MNNLYKLTPMQTSFAVNMVALDKGTPKTLTLKQAPRSLRVIILRLNSNL